MLENLVETIETLQKRIREQGSHIGAYEARTRATLVDPLLGALGWDVADPQQVQVEPKGPSGWADYALMSSNGKSIVAFIEAKKLTDTRTPLSQVVGYAVSENIENNTNIRYVITTNGNNWDIYDIVTQTAVTTTSLQTEESEAAAFKLLSLWQRSFREGRLNSVVKPVLVGPEVDPPPPPPPPPEASNGLTWRNIPQPKEAKNAWGPQTIKFPDGTEAHSGRSWRRTVVETAKWLHDTDKLTSANLPVVSSIYSYMTYYLVSADGRHSDGSEFRKPHKIADGVILNYSEFNATNAVTKIQKLLEHCSIDVDSVRLGFRPEDLKEA